MSFKNISFLVVNEKFCASLLFIDNQNDMARKKTTLALRVNGDNPNHHLWNNRGVWWCHLTVHKSDATAERLRFSLKTRDVDQARHRRDKIFDDIAKHYDIAA